MDEATAYIMVNLMMDVVRGGTATKAKSLGVPVAGKTGTTNAFRDAWFMGYTPEILTGVWLGLDEFKSMGRGQYGGEVALPVWIEYMQAAVEKYPPSSYEKPKGIVFAKVDSMTGKLAHEGEPAHKVPYRKGTDPTEFAPKAGQIDAADFLSGGF
jgi:penicillin-binding protein 1A